MSTKIFLTGATGYIGGDILHALYTSHPEYSYTALVRNEEKKQQVAAQFPNIGFALGDLDDSELLVTEASKADIVIHTADSSDHKGAAEAFTKGLAIGHTEDKPGFWLHTSGTGILCWKDMETETFGDAPSPDMAYDDLDGVGKLTSLPDNAFHRDVDKIVLAAGQEYADRVKTAIICPPSIYGPGRGPVGRRSRQVPNLVSNILKEKRTLQLGAGKTEWDNVNIHDLSTLYVLLVEAAVERRLDSELWGEKGYFLTENGTHAWGQLSRAVGDAARKQGYISSNEVKQLSPDEAKEIGGFEALSWGLNSKGKALRAKKFLGWKPVGPSLESLVSEMVVNEAELLGLKNNQ